MSDQPHPPPATPDLSYLDPHQLRVGGVGIFAGDWACRYDTAGQAVVPVGFVGTLTDTWNGWAVFSCTRDVAVEIVADHQRARDAERAQLIAAGVRADKVDHHVDAALARMEFDGDDIVVDHRVAYGDPDALWRISPDAEGLYNVMGGTWTWVPVAADDCRRIAGTIPAEGDRQRFVYLIHSDLRAPHDRLTVATHVQLPTSNGVAFTATLHLDGHTVGTVTNTGTGGPTTLHNSGDPELRQRVADFVAQCRWHGQPATQEQVLDALISFTDHRGPGWPSSQRICVPYMSTTESPRGCAVVDL